jgi:hypothetical protein
MPKLNFLGFLASSLEAIAKRPDPEQLGRIGLEELPKVCRICPSFACGRHQNLEIPEMLDSISRIGQDQTFLSSETPCDKQEAPSREP